MDGIHEPLQLVSVLRFEAQVLLGADVDDLISQFREEVRVEEVELRRLRGMHDVSVDDFDVEVDDGVVQEDHRHESKHVGRLDFHVVVDRHVLRLVSQVEVVIFSEVFDAFLDVDRVEAFHDVRVVELREVSLL